MKEMRARSLENYRARRPEAHVAYRRLKAYLLSLWHVNGMLNAA